MYYCKGLYFVTGVEIYDTCGSHRQTAAILRDRLSTSSCNTSETPSHVSGKFVENICYELIQSQTVFFNMSHV